VTRILKADIQSRLDDTEPPVAEMLLREIDSPHEYVLMRWVARSLTAISRGPTCGSAPMDP